MLCLEAVVGHFHAMGWPGNIWPSSTGNDGEIGQGHQLNWVDLVRH